MAKNLKQALEDNRRAAEDLDRALRECLDVIRERPENVVEGRFRLIAGGRRQAAHNS